MAIELNVIGTIVRLTRERYPECVPTSNEQNVFILKNYK